jgi:hypothetical protein
MANLAFLCQAHDAVRNALVALAPLIEITVFESLPQVRVEKGGGIFSNGSFIQCFKKVFGENFKPWRKYASLGTKLSSRAQNF